MPFTITIISDQNSWINDYIPELVASLIQSGHNLEWLHEMTTIPKGDFLFCLSFSKIIPEAILARNKHNLVVHESNLPEGKGWSPLTWQILAGKSTIPITLFEAGAQVDSGKIYSQESLELKGTELIDELRQAQAMVSIRLCKKWIQQYPEILAQGRKQNGRSTFYARRTPQDSQLDPNQTIRAQFNLLRVVDNDRYPAFFEIDGEVYILKIQKQE
ncbi:methionyl-tRNA formyltransferase-like protein [Thalassoporum mexicanum PCC 7367]|uniref:formyltransferase family protein n=1 Tax=Thalassoporum mexicanum TaxID=3457544 RepID=UPI00029FB82C|nr:formyltransferase family protein [Pseudanabaena sp. PCC 7367]AFY69684.1 methionyl-tRNA formyltransferase-like protein [Pseudanabaena sp. PCC 7367]